MNTSQKGTKTARITTDKPLVLGQEYKSILAADGYFYLRATPIMQFGEGDYAIHYQSTQRLTRSSLLAYQCKFCDRDCFEYFVFDRVFVREKIGLERQRAAHLSCVERELGRRLRLSDFPECPANEQVRVLFKMGFRAGRRFQRRKDRRGEE